MKYNQQEDKNHYCVSFIFFHCQNNFFYIQRMESFINIFSFLKCNLTNWNENIANRRKIIFRVLKALSLQQRLLCFIDLINLIVIETQLTERKKFDVS